MTETATHDEEIFTPQEIPLGGGISSYISFLTQSAPSTISFRTGAGRIFRDLLIHWPTIDTWENEAQELCQRITDAVYPLTGVLFAQAVDITVTISPTPIEAPARIDAMSTYVVFDVEKNLERLFFLSPKHDLPQTEIMETSKGIVVLCRPLHYLYHTIKDDRQDLRHPLIGIFEMPERMIAALYELPDFVPRDKILLDSIKTKIKSLPKTIENDAEQREANLALPSRHLSLTGPVLAATTSLSALSPPVRALERRIMMHVMDKSLSADMRLGLRRVAQNLRAIYPQAIVVEAAHQETERPAFIVSPPATGPALQPILTRQPTQQPILTPTLQPVMPLATTGQATQTQATTPTTQPIAAVATAAQFVRQPEAAIPAPRPATPLVTAAQLAQPQGTATPTAQPITPVATAAQELQSQRATTPVAQPASPQTTTGQVTQTAPAALPVTPVATAEQSLQPQAIATPAAQPATPQTTTGQVTQTAPAALPVTPVATAEQTAQPQAMATPTAQPISTQATAELVAQTIPTAQPVTPVATTEQTPQPQTIAAPATQPVTPQTTAGLVAQATPTAQPITPVATAAQELQSQQATTPAAQPASPQTAAGLVAQATPTQQPVTPLATSDRRTGTRERRAWPRSPTPSATPSPRPIDYAPQRTNGFFASSPHRFTEPEVRQKGFYDRLRPSAPSAFPKAVSSAGVGGLNKSAFPSSGFSNNILAAAAVMGGTKTKKDDRLKPEKDLRAQNIRSDSPPAPIASANVKKSNKGAPPKLDKDLIAQAEFAKNKLWATFPTPSPTPTPRSPVTRKKA